SGCAQMKGGVVDPSPQKLVAAKTGSPEPVHIDPCNRLARRQSRLALLMIAAACKHNGLNALSHQLMGKTCHHPACRRLIGIEVSGCKDHAHVFGFLWLEPVLPRMAAGCRSLQGVHWHRGGEQRAGRLPLWLRHRLTRSDTASSKQAWPGWFSPF